MSNPIFDVEIFYNCRISLIKGGGYYLKNKVHILLTPLVFVLFLLLFLHCPNTYINKLFDFSYVEVDFKSTNNNDIMVLFYDNGTENVFDDDHIVTKKILDRREEQTLVFFVPLSEINKIRLDFATSKGKTVIHSIKVRKNIFMSSTIVGEDIIRYFDSTNMLSKYEINENGNVSVEYCDNDPFIVCNDINQIPYTFSLFRGLISILKIILLCLLPSICVVYFITGLVNVLIDKSRNKKDKDRFVANKIIEILNKPILWIDSIQERRFVVIILGAYSLFCFTITRILYGKYSFDEFYALGSLDLSFNTKYDRQLVINALVRLLSFLFGNNYYTGKFVAMIFGVISFYYCNKIVRYYTRRNSFSIYLMILFLLNVYILFNHFYVRFYIFEEMCFSAISYYSLKVYKEEKSKYYIALCFFVLILLFGIKDSSRFVIIAITISTIIISYINKKIIIPKQLYFILFIIMCVMSAIVILLKISIVDNKVIKSYASDTPVFFFFSVTTLLVYFISYGIYVLSININISKEKDIMPLSALSFGPIFIYEILFNKYRVLRTFTPYLPIILVFSIIVLHRMDMKKIRRLLLGVLLITQTISFDGVTFNKQWSSPVIVEECKMYDYYAPSKKLRQYEKEGYKTAAAVAMVQQLKSLDFGRAVGIYMVGDNNKRINNANEIYIKINEVINNNTVVFVDNYCLEKLDSIDAWKSYLEEYEIYKYESGIILSPK